jgi:deoxycytidylate deaminase
MSRIHRFVKNVFVFAQSIEPFPNAKIGAMIVKGNRVVSYGYNQKKTDPLQHQYAKTEGCDYIHAEIHALKNALRVLDPDELSECTLFVARAKRPHKGSKRWIQGIAKPCPGCQKAISDFGIGTTVYTLDTRGFSIL